MVEKKIELGRARTRTKINKGLGKFNAEKPGLDGYREVLKLIGL